MPTLAIGFAIFTPAFALGIAAGIALCVLVDRAYLGVDEEVHQ